TDLGLRGNFKNIVSFDASVFSVFYNNRIGFAQKVLEDGRIISERGNIGDALIYGVESLFDVNLKKILNLNNQFSLNYFINSSFIHSEYTSSQVPGIVGNKVEYVPEINIKTGFKFGYKTSWLAYNIRICPISLQMQQTLWNQI